MASSFANLVASLADGQNSARVMMVPAVNQKQRCANLWPQLQVVAKLLHMTIKVSVSISQTIDQQPE